MNSFLDLSNIRLNMSVYGKRASHKWEETISRRHSVEGKHPDFFETLSNESAKKVIGETPPDLMACCDYHIHRRSSECDTIVCKEIRNGQRNGWALQEYRQ